jgi:hypothetical protein
VPKQKPFESTEKSPEEITKPLALAVTESKEEAAVSIFMVSVTTTGNGSAINSLNLNKIYILTSKSTASASELVINGLKPYINVVQIGDVTTGKNVGSVTFSSSSPAWTNPDTTPPNVTTTAFNAAENQTAIGTLTANEAVTWSKVGGVDSATVSIVSATGVITFNSAPNFEAPSDVGADNVYNVTVRATDTAGNITNQAITVTVTDVVDTSAFSAFQLAGGATVAAYRTAIVITATVTIASKISFYSNGKVLPGCKNKLATGSGSSFTANCTWRASTRGAATLTAAATPTGAGISGAIAPQLNIRVGNRTGAR